MAELTLAVPPRPVNGGDEATDPSIHLAERGLPEGTDAPAWPAWDTAVNAADRFELREARSLADEEDGEHHEDGGDHPADSDGDGPDDREPELPWHRHEPSHGPGTCEALGLADTVELTETRATEAPRPSWSASRPIVELVQVTASGLDARVEVGLVAQGLHALGSWNGPSVEWHVLRGAAVATAAAVDELSGSRVHCAVEYAEAVDAGTATIALVVLVLLAAGRAERLAGAAMVADDARQAMVRATLDALNRRLESLLADVES